MRLHLLSDLHLEFAPFAPPRPAADVVVLAGDTHNRGHGWRWAQATFPDVPVLYLMGNHEFYGEKLPRLTEKLRVETAATNIQILENRAVEIGGWRCFGCTLWTDFRLTGDATAATAAARDMNDYHRVRHWPSFRKLAPHHTRALHAHSLAALEQFLVTGDPRRSIVLTHHAPSGNSLPVALRPDALSAAYASHLDDFILRHQPTLWVHGHIHQTSDYCLGRTRIVCNPRGYPGEITGFKPELVVDVGE